MCLYFVTNSYWINGSREERENRSYTDGLFCLHQRPVSIYWHCHGSHRPAWSVLRKYTSVNHLPDKR